MATAAEGLIKALGSFLMKLMIKASQPADEINHSQSTMHTNPSTDSAPQLSTPVVMNVITTPSSETPQTQPSLNEIQLSTLALQNTGAAGAELPGFRAACFSGGHTPDHSIFQPNFNFDLDTFNPNLDKLFHNWDGEYESFKDFRSSNNFV
ncbi:hypothetical protein PAXRUDRAFT_19662 [Paxillus rubicundulus Ve08.2h10]|uniref:Unplaced genomic scaffold scaffold_3850, whole genome shotgun sequence n=1 Tax=Paxillus rubicundulus Ve08.2h10 TaxID=930991 RepID=A0A0D0D3V5_9AGAM|nr:hypothetical protein PAXRUDRAFT_19662 [Paxillus rubicundulus Ve08.2h10]